jgi:hypothetical protein
VGFGRFFNLTYLYIKKTMSKEMREQINKVKNFGQFLNESKLNRNQLYDIVEKYFNEHQDGYVKLNFEIEHNYKKLHFIELYKYNDGLHGDDFNFYFKTEDGKEGSWYFSTIDTTTLNDIVQKMVGG